MRKNVKKQLALRVLSTAALLAMVSSIATAAFADTYDLNKGSVTVETRDDGYTYVTQVNNNGSNGQPDTTGVTITSGGTPTSNTITVNTADNQTTNVTLQDVNIKEDQWSGGAAMTINGKGDTEIELNGDNTLISGNHHAGLEKAGDVSQGSLTIKDDKNNNGSDKAKDEDGDIGTLIAAGGYDGAGIGGRKNEDGEATTCTSTSDITITGGKIKAGSSTRRRKNILRRNKAVPASAALPVAAMPPILPSPAMLMYLLRAATMQPGSVAAKTAMPPTSSFPAMPRSLQPVQAPAVLELAVATLVQAAFLLQTMPM